MRILIFLILILTFQLNSAYAERVKPTFKQSFAVTDITGDNIGGPADVTLSPDGTKIHFTNFTNEDASTSYHKLRQFTLTTPFDISTLDTATEVQIDLNAGSDDLGDFVQGHEFNNDGTKVIVIQQGGKLNIHTLTTPYDISDFSQDADDGVKRDLRRKMGKCVHLYPRQVGITNHSTGHGIGLEVHTLPRIHKSNKQLLESNQVITIEPGICIMISGFSKTREALEKSGVIVHTFDGSSLCIGCEGGPTCLTRPILRA